MRSDQSVLESIIEEEWITVRDMLLQKNEAYGDSASKPMSVLAPKLDETTLILVRMDDKLSRLVRGKAAGEDVLMDLIGYAVLYSTLSPDRQGKTTADKIRAVVSELHDKTCDVVTHDTTLYGAAPIFSNIVSRVERAKLAVDIALSTFAFYRATNEPLAAAMRAIAIHLVILRVFSKLDNPAVAL